MAHFIVTFRIKNDSTYQERYDSFVKKAEELAKYPVWDQTTSFLTFQADSTAASLCSSLYVGSEFNATKDVMVVIDLDRKEKDTRGDIEDEYWLRSGLGF